MRRTTLPKVSAEEAAKIRATVHKIVANVNDVDDGRISWDEFSRRQSALWRAVDHGEHCVIGSACDARMTVAHKELERLRKS